MKNYIIILLLLGGFLTACDKQGKFQITGNITNADKQKIYLEQVTLSSIEPVDSAQIDQSGNFALQGTAPKDPSFFRLRLGDNFINLGIDSIEHIQINADAPTFGQNYEVSGSAVCEEMKQLTLKQIETEAAINRLKKENKSGTLSDSLYYIEAIKALNDMKKFSKTYIIRQPQSLVAYYALFQKINGGILFDPYDKEEAKLFAAVANVLNFYYPDNERTKRLYQLALEGMAVIKNSAKNDSVSDFPVENTGMIDISLPTIDGQKISLSDYAKGNITLLDFTGYELDYSPLHTMLLGELYEKYKNKGFRIYQISIDEDEHIWKNKASKFPWMCVKDDINTPNSIFTQYNIQGLPTSFLIDRSGNIIQRIDGDKDLESIISSYF
ncbi:MAG: TlpA disulfide reductase family protein [Bacteroidales bacterium]|nr:TlpA disulfide reductase family protein [Bacteroidales bacterium]